MVRISFQYICGIKGGREREKMGCIPLNIRFRSMADMGDALFHNELLAVMVCVGGDARVCMGNRDYVLSPGTFFVIRPGVDIAVLECREFAAKCIFFNPIMKSDVVIPSQFISHFYLSVARSPVVHLEEGVCRQFKQIMRGTELVLSSSRYSYFHKASVQHYVAGVLYSIFGSVYPHDGTSVVSPVAPQQRKAKQRKILIFNENRDFLFSPKTQKSAVHDRLWWSRRWSKQVFQTSPP